MWHGWSCDNSHVMYRFVCVSAQGVWLYAFGLRMNSSFTLSLQCCYWLTEWSFQQRSSFHCCLKALLSSQLWYTVHYCLVKSLLIHSQGHRNDHETITLSQTGSSWTINLVTGACRGLVLYWLEMNQPWSQGSMNRDVSLCAWSSGPQLVRSLIFCAHSWLYAEGPLLFKMTENPFFVCFYSSTPTTAVQ